MNDNDPAMVDTGGHGALHPDPDWLHPLRELTGTAWEGKPVRLIALYDSAVVPDVVLPAGAELVGEAVSLGEATCLFLACPGGAAIGPILEALARSTPRPITLQVDSEVFHALGE